MNNQTISMKIRYMLVLNSTFDAWNGKAHKSTEFKFTVYPPNPNTHPRIYIPYVPSLDIGKVVSDKED